MIPVVHIILFGVSLRALPFTPWAGLTDALQRAGPAPATGIRGRRADPPWPLVYLGETRDNAYLTLHSWQNTRRHCGSDQWRVDDDPFSE